MAQYTKMQPSVSQPTKARAGSSTAAQCSKIAAFLLVLLAPNTFLWAQAGGVIPVPRQTFLDNSGNPVTSGSLYHYQCGTTTDLNVYSDAALSSALPQPVTLNSAGRPQTAGLVETAIYLTAVCHKFVLKDSGGSTIWTQDNVYPQNYLGSGSFGNTYFLRGDATSGYTWARPVTVITTTSTGTQDDFAPGLVGDTVLRCNNAALLTIRGFSGGYDGQRLWLVSIGAGQVDLAHQNAGSSAANRLINYATSASTSLAAGVGTALYVYDGTTARWRLVAHEQGAPITATYSALNFTASAGTWTVDSGDITTLTYLLRGRELTVRFRIENTDVSATPTDLLIGTAAWGGFTAAKTTKSPAWLDDAGTPAIGFWIIGAGLTNVIIRKVNTGAYTSTAGDNTDVEGVASFEVQ